MFGRVVLLLLFQCAECALTSQAIGHLRGGAAPEVAAPKKAVPEEAVRKEAVPEEAVPEEAVPEEAVPEEAVHEEAVPEEAVPEEAVPEEAVPEEAVPEEKNLSKAEARELLDSAIKILTGPANKQRLQEVADDAWRLPNADDREAMLADEVLPVAQSMMEGCLQKAGFEESDMMEAIEQIQAHAKGDGKMTEELNKLQKAMKGGGEEDHSAAIYDVMHPFADDDDYFGNATAAEVSALAEGEDDDFANTTADEVNKPVEGEDDDLAKSNAK